MTTLPEVENTWTPEQVYERPMMRPWPPCVDEGSLDELRANPKLSLFRPEFLAILLRETTWQQIAAPSSTRLGTPAPNEKCARCDGKGKIKVLYRGEITGIITCRWFTCDCGNRRFFYAIEHSTPARFRDVRLSSLSPSKQSILPAPRQAEIIGTLQARPDDSYFLYGTPGTGKSHMASAVYHETVWKSICAQVRRQDMQAAVWRVSASTLLREHKDWETRDKNNYSTEPPSVTEKAIRNAAAKGYRPCLFIDEIDKFSTTEFRVNTLAEIVDAIYVAEGQIVATSNKSPADLEAKWGSDEAGTILRRIGSEVNAHMIEFA